MSKKMKAAKSSPSGSKGRNRRPGGDKGLTRRGFIGASAAAGGVALTSTDAKAAGKAKTLGPRKATLKLNVNGKDRTVNVEPRVTLLRALRTELDITGPK